ncbi:Signal transduction histidine kinase [Nitrosomonas aestuarii]|uniref:histidine kinase n=1 Tax=Nitrosomonas aestuarii TaxID=52441 RepID=A0A1I3X236_9PROT|nr:Signal transduction histidine kinase [Nitrosomonas aestuarii]
MQKTKRLRRRITFAFLFFGAAVILVLGLSLVVALKSIETSVLDEILYTELIEFQKQAENDSQMLESSRSRATIIIYTSSLNEMTSLPEHVRNLSQGIHDVTHKDRDYRVLVAHIDDMRYVVQFDATSIHKRERDFIRLVWLCAIVTLVIAFFIGWGVALHVIRPIKRLAYQVMAFTNQPGESLDLSEFGDDEIGVLARKLQDYHEQLQYLLIREKEFASSVSHELGTPVTNISMAAEVLAMKKDLSVPEHARIRRIQRAVGEMTELIDTFLILAKIDDESNKSDIVCQMEPIVRKVIEQQRVWLGEKPIQVTIETNGQLEVVAHPGILSVLVANLMRNAFQYTMRGSITVLLAPNQLSVGDTGVGIDSTAQSQIFKGYRMNNADDSNRTGLGLTIVQRICEYYGWKVSFKSKKGQGSQFTVLFATGHAPERFV